MSFATKLKGFGWVLISILSLGYVMGFLAALLNYSEILEWLADSSILGIILAILFQVWVWITGFVLLYLTFKELRERFGRNK